MITISQSQLEKVEYIISQSSQGNHLLFDLEVVRRAFAAKSAPMNAKESEEIEKHIEKLMGIEALRSQRSYLEQLPEKVLFRVVKTYFNIVENTVFESSTVRH